MQNTNSYKIYTTYAYIITIDYDKTFFKMLTSVDLCKSTDSVHFVFLPHYRIQYKYRIYILTIIGQVFCGGVTFFAMNMRKRKIVPTS